MTGAARFEAFVGEYQDMVFATAVRLLANPAEAEDVAQTVFLRAFQRFGEIETSPARAGWLKTVATNLCLTHLMRYRARWQFFSEIDASRPAGAPAFESTLVAPSDDGNPWSPGSPDPGWRSEQHDELEIALRRLPDHQRVPLVLFHFEERSYQDIATTLGVSLAKVKTDIHRGRESLKHVLTARRPSRAAV
jgi:RNA polymerase sigma-70 factor (ECF subfamily)